MRPRYRTLTAAAALAAGLLAPAAAAQAGSGTIVVASAGSPASHVGELSIGFDATSTIDASGITALLYPAGSPTAAMTVTGFTQTSGPATGPGATVWTVTTPIAYGSGPGELPLGTYSIEVRASDQGGDTTDTPDAGTLAYLIQPLLTLSVNPTSYSLGQNVTLSGTDIGLYPDGSHQPLSQQLDFGGNLTTTDSAGSFSETVQAGIGASGTFLAGPRISAGVIGSMTTAPAYSNAVPVTIVKAPVRITETVTPSVLSPGQTASVFGSVSVEEGSTWQPMADVGLYVSIPGFWGRGVGPIWNATTDNSGSYAVSIQADLPRHYRIDLGDSPYSGPLSPWLSVTPATFTLAPEPVAVSERINAQTASTGRVQIWACETMTGASGPFYWPAPGPPRLDVQYAVSAAGPWRSLESAVPAVKEPDEWICAKAMLKAPGRSDFYRAASSGDATYTAGVSSKVQAAPLNKSNIHGFTVSPRSLKAGSQVKMSGQLSALTVANKIEILFRAAGSKRWRVIRRLSTHLDSSGNVIFAASIRMFRSGSIEARYNGGEFTAPCRSRVVYIRVTR